MSLYSYGKLETTALGGKSLPYPGGWDKEGNLTTEPQAILESQRLIPAGLWKGSGLAIALDMAAAILSNGRTTADLGRFGKGNSGCSQIFIAINPQAFCDAQRIEALMEDTKAQLRSAAPAQEGDRAWYPGERTLETRKDHREKGIPVDPVKWQEVRTLAGLQP
jgi:3-dehydro-L-gulonate 2-dehydrogenase